MRSLWMLGWGAAAVLAVGLSQTEPARMAYGALAAAAAPRAMPSAALRAGDASRQAAAAIDLGRQQIALARLAAERSAREPVREYALNIVASRQGELKSLDGIAGPEAGAEPEAPVPEGLAGLSGRAFDRAYLDATIQEQQRSVALLERQAREAASPELVGFAFAELPQLRRELAEAHRLAVAAALAPPDPQPPTRRPSPPREPARPRG